MSTAVATRRQEQGDRGLPPIGVNLVAGLAAGFMSTIVVHPLDVVKTRLQVDNAIGSPKFGATFRIASQIVAKEGLGLLGLYRGLTPNIAGNMASWSLYFVLYENFKLKFASADDPNARLKAPEYLLSSATAGVLAAIFTNPFWVVKTRMLTTAINKPGAYLSMTDGFRKILRTEGPRGLMRGFVPSMFLVGQGAITFVCYELLKNWRAGEKGKLGSIDYLALSAAAKTASGTLTYPYRVVQTRMQNFDVGYKGPIDVLRKIWRVEGFSGLYKGLAPNIVRVLPSTCITFVVYENVKHALQ